MSFLFFLLLREWIVTQVKKNYRVKKKFVHEKLIEWKLEEYIETFDRKSFLNLLPLSLFLDLFIYLLQIFKYYS